MSCELMKSFEGGIQNLVCGCILGWQSVMYQFCDLDLIYTIIFRSL